MALRVLSNIVCVDEFTICISGVGKVYSFGRHVNCAHGHDDYSVFPPRIIPSLFNIKSVCCSGNHTICLDYDGIVFTFGDNEFGQLGIGKDSEWLPYTHEPQKLHLPSIRQISCGFDFTICLSEDSDLYSFGNNEFGELGLGNNEPCNFPQKIESLSNIDFIECGDDHAVCKTFSGDVYVWGCNNNEQLGIGTTIDQNIPIICDDWPDDIIDVKCGDSYTLVLTLKQEVYSCGFGIYGQLGRITGENKCPLQKIKELSEIIRIECCYRSSICIDIYDNLFVFGDNRFGQLGLGDTNNRHTPIKHPTLSNIIDISSKGDHVFVKTTSNGIYAFGRCDYPQLGIETEDDKQLNPIQVLQGYEDIWCSNINRKSRAKSARK